MPGLYSRFIFNKDFKLTTSLSVFLSCVKPVTDTQHKIVRVLEFVKLISGVQENMLCYVCLQHKCLVE